jgi:hypothetical protein
MNQWRLVLLVWAFVLLAVAHITRNLGWPAWTVRVEVGLAWVAMAWLLWREEWGR